MQGSKVGARYRVRPRTEAPAHLLLRRLLRLLLLPLRPLALHPPLRHEGLQRGGVLRRRLLVCLVL